MPQRRVLPSIYEDNISLPVGIDPTIRYSAGSRSVDQTQGQPLPLVRSVSNSLARVADADVISDIQYTHLLTVWGQYIDHDLGITPQAGFEREIFLFLNKFSKTIILKILDYFNFF